VQTVQLGSSAARPVASVQVAHPGAPGRTSHNPSVVNSSSTRTTTFDQRKVPNSLVARAGVYGVSESRTGWGLAGFQRGRVQPQFAALDADQRSVVINNNDTHDERYCDRRTALTRMSCPDAST